MYYSYVLTNTEIGFLEEKWFFLKQTSKQKTNKIQILQIEYIITVLLSAKKTVELAKNCHNRMQFDALSNIKEKKPD